MSYPAYQKLFNQHFEFVEAARARIFVFAMSFEVERFFLSHPEFLSDLRSTSVWLLSEEPLWDSTWNWQNRLDKAYSITVLGIPVVINQISHFVRSPFVALDVPYFLTTNDNFFLYYQLFFYKRMTQPLLLRQPRRGIGLMEFRTDLRHDVLDEAGKLIGLSNYRVRLLQYLRHIGLFDAAGSGWSGPRMFPERRRQEARDFHLQKLVMLESQYGFVFALENTLQLDYVTEKLFDALAVGGVPLYLANAGHEAFRFVKQECVVNVTGLTFEEVAQNIVLLENVREDIVFEAVRHCAPLFDDFSLLEHVRGVVTQRIVNAILEEIEA